MGKQCKPYEEIHKIVVVRGIGCSKERARDSIFAKLLRIALDERETKCEKLECTGLEAGKCVTTLDPEDVKRLEKQIAYYPVRNDECPEKIGWMARLVADPPKYRSECICVPEE